MQKLRLMVDMEAVWQKKFQEKDFVSGKNNLEEEYEHLFSI